MRAAARIALALAAAGCAGRTVPPRPSDEPYRIGPEDILEISVWNNAEVSRRVPVRPDGMISLPLVHEVRAAGLTPLELRDLLVRQLSRFTRAPEVSVIVQEVHSPKVLVVGEVVHPGRYVLRGPTTVLDALAMAGGPNEFAARAEIVVVRRGRDAAGERAERYVIDESDLTADAARHDFRLRDGDVVVVP